MTGVAAQGSLSSELCEPFRFDRSCCKVEFLEFNHGQERITTSEQRPKGDLVSAVNNIQCHKQSSNTVLTSLWATTSTRLKNTTGGMDKSWQHPQFLQVRPAVTTCHDMCCSTSQKNPKPIKRRTSNKKTMFLGKPGVLILEHFGDSMCVCCVQ